MNYILNCSFMVMPKAHGSWYELVVKKFVPSLKECGNFSKVTLSRVLSAESVEHYTYSLLIEMDNLDGYKYFTSQAMVSYSDVAKPMFGGDVCHFITLMKPVDNEN